MITGEEVREITQRIRRLSAWGISEFQEEDRTFINYLNELTNKGMSKQEAIDSLAQYEVTNRETEATRRYLTIIYK